MNDYTSIQFDQAIQATKEIVEESTRHSETFFASIGGAGSSGVLLVQGQALIVRGRQMTNDDKISKAAAVKA